jgi:exoribonuclease-2
VGSGSSSWRERGREPAARAQRPALEAFLEKRRRADPTRFPDVSLSVVKLLAAASTLMELPGDEPKDTSGSRVKDYTTLHGAEPALSRISSRSAC